MFKSRFIKESLFIALPETLIKIFWLLDGAIEKGSSLLKINLAAILLALDVLLPVDEYLHYS